MIFSPDLDPELQISISNLQFDPSTWMSNGHPKLNTIYPFVVFLLIFISEKDNFFNY